MVRFAAVLVAAVALALPATAGEFNKKVNIGDKAPTFTGLEGVDGKKLSSGDCTKDVCVVVITCNHCPVAVAYEDRIIELAKKYGTADSKVGIVAINVNNSDADKLDKMKERAKAKGFNFPYVYDPSQKIAKDLGATVTPEFFVYDKDRKLVYTGALDDNQDASKVKEKYLEQAIEAALKGTKPVKAETKPKGCGVQYDK